MGNRIVHALIAVVEFLPVVSQISSIFEKLIVDNFSSSSSWSERRNLKNFEEYKKKLLESIPEVIEEQKKIQLTKSLLKFSKKRIVI